MQQVKKYLPRRRRNRSSWSNYFWSTGHCTKTWQLAGHFQQHGVQNNRCTRFKNKRGR